MVDCPEFIESYSDFRDGLLTTVRMERFESHLQTCESCARYDRVVGGGVQVFRSLPPLNLSPDFQARLLDRIRLHDTGVPRRASGSSFGVTLLICIAIGASAWIPTIRHESGPVRLPPIVAHAPYHDLAPALMRGGPAVGLAPAPASFVSQPSYYGPGLLLDQATARQVLAYRPANAFYIPR